MDSVRLITIVDAYKGRAVAIGDIKGVHLHAEMNKFIRLKLVMEEVDIMYNIGDEHTQHVSRKGGKKVLHLILNKVLWRYIQSALL